MDFFENRLFPLILFGVLGYFAAVIAAALIKSSEGLAITGGIVIVIVATLLGLLSFSMFGDLAEAVRNSHSSDSKARNEFYLCMFFSNGYVIFIVTFIVKMFS